MEYSIVIPVFNEAESVGPLVEEIRSKLGGKLDHELILVDDGSSDDTLDRLKARREEHAELRVLSHRRRCGQSAAIWSGVHAAKAPWVITMDGDGQNDPADAVTLVEALAAAERREEIDMVAGFRRDRRDSWLKKISSRIANSVRAALLKDGCRDTGCGLKLIRREAFLSLPFFDHMHRFLPALIIRRGGGVIQVGVSHRPRESGKSKYGMHNRLWVGIVDLCGVLWLQRRAVTPVVDEV